ncbi:methylene-fatty-acyl-phospholipid synthase [Strigomonas culicis]|uniref:Phosphatidylethanolamine N-methyltransferase n=1 Tax=Strigomonas culicis TaxID=28005 RepID=S9UW24_9TRYP|nr:methylene-fatty-acyl-phospholipid synthase [Strigomonas culicis]EPY30406.1 methylene-fatty-acyl-phospholipid synthase [Strigomonas culicis]EPY33083.1 methylene-fatty-acyl-phospholipid synthase [Strigomonas culicis]|eukprot:EPY25191.1 methylene-fatty-acyl-phospholipid synthase [Strigomonas culicis]
MPSPQPIASALHYPSIGMAAIAIGGLPVAWNIVARNEYRNKSIQNSPLFLKFKKNNRQAAAYLLAVGIFVASCGRDALFKVAMDRNPSSVLPLLCPHMFGRHREAVFAAIKCIAYALFTFGSTLVLTSFARLGVTGTYLGDYCGILMKERVTAFPFSHFENPMYLGATLNFFAAALAENNAVGVLLTGWVGLVYHVTTTYCENPFTSKIYEDKDKH